MNTTGEVQHISEFLLQSVWKTPRVDFCSTLTIGCESSQQAVSDPYRSLDPFLDNTKVLRVGGRLQNSSLALDEKHPMLLPAGHEVTRLIFENKHRQLKHCGPQALLANTRQQFWTIKGKQLVLTTVRRCITCCRARPRLLNQIMSPLPTDRVQIARPFNISGGITADHFLCITKSEERNPIRSI